MTTVVLTGHWQGHAPGETVEVDETTAFNLMLAGVALPPSKPRPKKGKS